jgi:hypothetical protein
MKRFVCGPRSIPLNAMMVKVRAESRVKMLDENTASTRTLSLLGNLIFHRTASGKRTRMVSAVKSANKKN